jgi:hypothetical protein
MTGSRLSVWLTATVGVLMVFSRTDRPGFRLSATGERFSDADATMRGGWSLLGGSAPFESWRTVGDVRAEIRRERAA